MTFCVTVTHHSGGSAAGLRADVYHINLYGQVDDIPVRTHELPPGGAAIVHLHKNNWLVVRELHQADADDQAGA